MFSAGYCTGRGSYSGSLPWRVGICLVLLRPACKIFPIPPEVAIPSAQWKRGDTLCYFCPYFHRADPCILVGRQSVWNELLLAQRLLLMVHLKFYSSLRTVLFSRAGIRSVSE